MLAELVLAILAAPSPQDPSSAPEDLEATPALEEAEELESLRLERTVDPETGEVSWAIELGLGGIAAVILAALAARRRRARRRARLFGDF